MSDSLQINERIRLDELTYARFDGTHIILETLGVDRVRITPLAMSRLHWMHEVISDSFPHQWFVDLAEAERFAE